MSSTQTLLEKLEETRRRIDELYHSSREEANTDDDDKARKLFGPTDAWKSWFPEHAADFGLPHAYRDMSRLREQRFVEEHLYGASADVFRQLSSLDALLLKFLILRRLDSESAATRFLAFRTLVIDHDLVWSFNHADVQAGLQSNALHFVPVIEPQENRPVVAVFPRRIDYKILEVQQVKRAWFFAMMTAVTWTPTAQTAGMVLLNSMKDVSMAQVNSEFRKFLSQAINQAIPARFARSFVANEPFFFGTVVWPLFKYAISEKLRSRMSVVGTNYELVLAALPPRCVPEEMGGERPNGDEELARLMRLYKFTPLPGQKFVPVA